MVPSVGLIDLIDQSSYHICPPSQEAKQAALESIVLSFLLWISLWILWITSKTRVNDRDFVAMHHTYGLALHLAQHLLCVCVCVFSFLGDVSNDLTRPAL